MTPQEKLFCAGALIKSAGGYRELLRGGKLAPQSIQRLLTAAGHPNAWGVPAHDFKALLSDTAALKPAIPNNVHPFGAESPFTVESTYNDAHAALHALGEGLIDQRPSRVGLSGRILKLLAQKREAALPDPGYW